MSRFRRLPEALGLARCIARGIRGGHLVGLAAAVMVLSPASGMAQSEDQTFQQFLSRLGLVELQVLHLEQSLQKTATDPALAVRLADLYASRLLDSADDDA